MRKKTVPLLHQHTDPNSRNNVFHSYVNSQKAYVPNKANILINSAKELSQSKQMADLQLKKSKLPPTLGRIKQNNKQVQTENFGAIDSYNTDYVLYNGQLAKILRNEREQDKPIIEQMVQIREMQRQKYNTKVADSLVKQHKQLQYQQLQEAQQYQAKQLSLKNMNEHLKAQRSPQACTVVNIAYQENLNLYTNKDLQLRSNAPRVVETEEQPVAIEQKPLNTEIPLADDIEYNDDNNYKMGTNFEDEPSQVIGEQQLVPNAIKDIVVEKPEEPAQSMKEVRSVRLSELRKNSFSYNNAVDNLKKKYEERKKNRKTRAASRQRVDDVVQQMKDLKFSFNSSVEELQAKYLEHKQKKKELVVKSDYNRVGELVVQMKGRSFTYNSKVEELKEKYKKLKEAVQETTFEKSHTMPNISGSKPKLEVEQTVIEVGDDKPMSFMDKVAALKLKYKKNKVQTQLDSNTKVEIQEKVKEYAEKTAIIEQNQPIERPRNNLDQEIQDKQQESSKGDTQPGQLKDKQFSYSLRIEDLRAKYKKRREMRENGQELPKNVVKREQVTKLLQQHKGFPFAYNNKVDELKRKYQQRNYLLQQQDDTAEKPVADK